MLKCTLPNMEDENFDLEENACWFEKLFKSALHAASCEEIKKLLLKERTEDFFKGLSALEKNNANVTETYANCLMNGFEDEIDCKSFIFDQLSVLHVTILIFPKK